ncbi:potassium channel subfamily K member 18-like isoform X2 [Anopheles albimanus]|uniref:potassium channel subfamily K member 18-like isoform X2 n=1 Tax=Anopheles albimanus TaxID=7167 RepID=UPI00163E08B8|nr:potassium channel subfamily K member 18-like isoform X2 [Anopheles albimanus]XP_035792726.1 potassium channel subfamily K member 18-like isoform X2 [Anopheles albimanus]
MTQTTPELRPPVGTSMGTAAGPGNRPRINLTMPPVYVAPPHVQAKYSPAHYFQQLHQQQQQQQQQLHQNPLYQPVTPGSPTRISLGPDGVPVAGSEQPDYTDYYSMYPAKAGEFMFKQLEGFRDFTMNTAKSGLGVGEKSVFWMYTKITRWSRNWFTHIFLFLMLFLYSVAGAALFIAVEGTHEKKMETNVNHAKRILAKNLRILALDREKLENPDPDIWEGRAINLVEEYSAVLYQSYKEGSFENKQNKKTWSFWNAVFYCGTIYTTIGYGHISPSTTTGRALTIVYAIIGIPIFLIVLADFGKLFTRGIKFLWAYVRRLYYTGSFRKVRKTAQVQEVMKGLNVVYDMVRRPSGDNELQAATTTTATATVVPQTPKAPPQPAYRLSTELPNAAPPTAASAIEVAPDTPTTPVPETFEIDDEFNLPISVAIFILVAYMLFGATIYFTWENWSFFEAFYFVFISISTIGFGDFVPQHPIYMMCSILYLIFGLALTSMCINVVQLKLSDSFRQASAKIGATIGLQMAEAASLHQSPIHTPIELAAVHTSTPTGAGSGAASTPGGSPNGTTLSTPALPTRPSSAVQKPDKKD